MTQVAHSLAAVQSAGLRLTDARRAIIERIARLPHPATIVEIAECTDVDTATVYRNIEPLVAAGALEAITVAGAPTRYALAHHHHHDHLVCERCGKIVHVPCGQPKNPTLTHPSFTTVTSHAITYYGVCTACA